MPKRKRQLTTGIIIAVIQIYLITYHFEQVWFVTSALAVSALIILWKFHFSKRMMLMFLIVAISGFVAEAVVVTNGAWTYASPHVLGLPIWLPIIWGSVGVVAAHLSDKLTKKYE